MYRNNSKGFTLIETIMAVMLLSIVSIALAGVFRSAFSGYRYADAQAGLDAGAEIIIERLRKDFQSIVPFSPVRFEGTAEKVLFVTLLPTTAPEGGVETCHSVVTYYYGGDVNPGLTRTCTPYCGRMADSTLLTDLIDSLAFSYGSIEENGTLEWKESWNSGENADHPAAIRVSMKLMQTAHGRVYTRHIEEIMFVNIAVGIETEADETAL